MPGNPVQEAISHATQSGVCNLQCVNAIRLELGFGVHTNLWVQYLQYWGNLFHGDLGSSWTQGNRESYMANADRAETDAEYRQQLEYLDGEPEWIDVNYAEYVGQPLGGA